MKRFAAAGMVVGFLLGLLIKLNYASLLSGPQNPFGVIVLLVAGGVLAIHFAFRRNASSAFVAAMFITLATCMLI